MFISRPCGGAAHRDGMQIILGRATPVQTLPPGAGRGQPGCPPPSLPPLGGGAWFPPPAGAVFVGGRSPSRSSRRRGNGATRLPHVHVSPRLRDAQPTGAGESGGSLQRPCHAVLSSAARRYHAWMGTPALSPRHRAIHSMNSYLYPTQRLQRWGLSSSSAIHSMKSYLYPTASAYPV